MPAGPRRHREENLTLFDRPKRTCHSEPVTDVTGVRIPQGFRPPISGFQRGIMSEKSVQFSSVTVGKLLASFRQQELTNHKNPMRTRNIQRIRQKMYKFATIHRRKEQSPFPTVKFDKLYVFTSPSRSFRRVTPRILGHCEPLTDALQIAPGKSGEFSRQSADWLRMTALLGLLTTS